MELARRLGGGQAFCGVSSQSDAKATDRPAFPAWPVQRVAAGRRRAESAPPRCAANSQLGLNRLLVPKRVRARLCELPFCLARGEAANEPHYDSVVLQVLHLVPATGRPV